MVFEALYEAQQRGELLIVDGGMCHWHLRRDGQLTIYEIFSNVPGSGRAILDTLKSTIGAHCIVAKCPVDLASNDWYGRRGFILDAVETTKTGRVLNVWKLTIGND